MRFFRPGFTMAELLVSIAILLIIAVFVAGDVTRTKYQEELASSARVLAGTFRDQQARALTVKSINTCLAAGVNVSCELATAGCTGACEATIPPYATGVTIVSAASNADRWVEVDVTLFDHRPDGSGREAIGPREFLTGTAGTAFVTVDPDMVTDVGTIPTAYVTFDRQNGAMRINACGTPNTPACIGTEPKTLAIVLRHSKTNRTRTVRLNAITGKISLE